MPRSGRCRRERHGSNGPVRLLTLRAAASSISRRKTDVFGARSGMAGASAAAPVTLEHGSRGPTDQEVAGLNPFGRIPERAGQG